MRRRHALLALPATALAATRVPLAVGEHGSAQWAQLLDHLARAAGLSFELRPLPWPRAQAFAADGQGLIFGLARTVERERRFVFTQTVVEILSWALVRADERERFGDGFARRTLCMGRGSSYPTQFAARGIAVGEWLESDQGDPATLRMLRAKRCDAAVITAQGRDAADTAQRLQGLGMDLQDLALLPRPLLRSALHFATGHRSRWLPQLRLLDAALRKERRAIDQLMLRQAG